MPALLDIDELSVHFGGVKAVDRVDMAVGAGSVHALIGPNGAGKTTLLNCISRLVPAASGRIAFDGVDILSLRAQMVAPLGIARTFQNLGLVEELSVLENVMIGLHPFQSITLFDELVLSPRRFASERRARASASEALALVGIGDLASIAVKHLSYGRRKMVELARAVSAGPRLLMLDEPTAGLSHAEMDQLRTIIGLLRADRGMTILVISHHMEFLMEVAEQITVLNGGLKIAEGTPAMVRSDPGVIAAYLGTED